MEAAVGSPSRVIKACMTISVLIPVYNHAPELVRCLRSLERQTIQPKEIIVVDDGSADAPKRFLQNAGMLDRVRFIELPHNGGAPIARNTAFAASTGEAVIFLDADATLRADALEQWQRALETHPEAAFAYSAFRFEKKVFRSQPYSVEALARGNYIHTSALIRREAFPGFDEALKKFQDWDVWIEMAKRGHEGVYIPELLLSFAERIQGGMSRWIPSFAYRLPWRMLGKEPDVVRRYREAEVIIRAKHRTWMESIGEVRQPAMSATRWMVIGMVIWGLSALNIGTWLNGWLAVVLAALVGALAFLLPEAALGWIGLELLIGSKGGLLKWGSDAVNDGGIGLRILQFAAFFLGWGIWAWRTGAWRTLLAPKRELVVWGVVTLAIGYGVLRGWALGQPFLVADANAWGFVALIIPIATLVNEKLKLVLRQSIYAGLTLLVGSTLALFFVFSHSLPIELTDRVYLWVRQSGLGEITRAGGSVFRIFLQSQVFLLPAWLWIWVCSWRDHLPLGWRTWVAWSAVSACILASFSRSYWIGLALASVVGMLLLLVSRASVKEAILAVVRPFAALVGGFVLLAALAWFPLWRGTAGLSSALSARFASGEAAVSSRWSLLPVMSEGIVRHPLLGSGFGATLTYTSSDPRIVQATGGRYTTYAFEWGWLDLWYKLGVFGVAAIVWLLIVIAVRAKELVEQERVWVWLSLLLLAGVHVFTPYINHPLGIGLLLWAWIVTETRKQEKTLT